MCEGYGEGGGGEPEVSPNDRWFVPVRCRGLDFGIGHWLWSGAEVFCEALIAQGALLSRRATSGIEDLYKESWKPALLLKGYEHSCMSHAFCLGCGVHFLSSLSLGFISLFELYSAMYTSQI